MRRKSAAFGSTSRRRFVAGAGAGVLAAPALLRAVPAGAAQTDLDAAILAVTKGIAPREGKVKVDAPSLAETGNAVQVTVTVESPMSGRDRVTAIHIFLEQNPEPNAAHFTLGPHAGKAEVTTRVRMFSPQKVHAVAAMSDGSFWTGSAHVEVTLAACVDIEIK